MSGVAKSVRKVFKKVGKVIKKIALPVLAIGAAVFTAGVLAPAIGTALGIGGVATAAGGAAAITGATGATAGIGGAALGGSGGITGLISGILGGGGAGGSILSSATVGNVIAGVGQGLGQYQQLKEAEKQQIRAERRQSAKYAGAGNTGFDFSGLGRTADLTDPTENFVLQTASTNRRPSVVEQAEAPGKLPRYRYNPENGRIETA